MQNLSLPPAPPAQNFTGDIADHVANLISSDLTEAQMLTALARTHLTEVERRIVIREVRAAREFVDSHEARVRAGWIDADRGGVPEKEAAEIRDQVIRARAWGPEQIARVQ